MKWIQLTTESQLQELIVRSRDIPQVIFKYSRQCSLSDWVRNSFQRQKTPLNIDFYFLDLIPFRSISNKVAERFSVKHESPQVLLIKNGECIYEESHLAIRMDEIILQCMAL
jgi:bacillithiol system protein YtxJ